MHKLDLDEGILKDARRFNRTLAWLPRFRVRNRFTPRLIQGLLRLSQLRAGSAMAAQGIEVTQCVAEADGHRVPVRLLRAPGPVRGIVLDLHGGGWVIGNAAMNDTLNADIALQCGVLVVSVDYRLATGTPLAGLLDDCSAALRWLLQGALPGHQHLPVFVVGESAGAHLAVATLLRLKAWPGLLARVRGAVLYYGVYDLAGTPSVRQAGPETLVLHGPGMASDLRQLTPQLSDAERRAPDLSPLFADLAGMPDALMFAGAIDPLRDDTLLLAQRWRDHAAVEAHLLPEAPHGFIRFPTTMARVATARTHAWLRQALQRLSA